MKTKFVESSIPAQYEYVIGNKPQVPKVVLASHVFRIYEIMMAATADFLKFVSANQDKVALNFEDPYQGFTVAALVERHKGENEEGEMPDNMSFTFTTNKDDLDGFVVYTTHDPQFTQICSVVAYEKHGMQFKQQDFFTDVFATAWAMLLDWLNTNASEKEVNEVEHEGYFLARVSVEDGQKYYEILPMGEIKTKIKNDTSNQK